MLQVERQFIRGAEREEVEWMVSALYSIPFIQIP